MPCTGGGCLGPQRPDVQTVPRSEVSSLRKIDCDHETSPPTRLEARSGNLSRKNQLMCQTFGLPDALLKGGPLL